MNDHAPTTSSNKEWIPWEEVVAIAGERPDVVAIDMQNGRLPKPERWFSVKGHKRKRPYWNRASVEQSAARCRGEGMKSQ